MSRGRALALSAGIVTAATFSGRIFGFVREMVIANKFGASAETDAFLVAFAIPNIIYSLVVMGALSASFIPVFSGLLANEDEKEAWYLAYSIFNLLLVVFGAITFALVLFAPQVIALVSPGFGTSSEQFALAANLLRLMAPALIFMGISGLMAGTLNSYHHFSTPSLVALVQNIVVVASIIVFAERLGIYGAAVGLLLGSIGQVLVQLPALLKRRFPYRAVIDIRQDTVKRIGKLFVPVLIGLAASQSNTVVDKWFASFLATGSISYLNFAFKVGSLPVGTLIAAIAIVLFPTFSQHAAKNDTEGLRGAVSLGVRMIALVAVPASVGLFVLRLPITRLLFEHGAFESSATLATAAALGAYSFGLPAMGLNMLAVRAFYALQDGMTPLKVSLAFAVLLIGLDVALVGPLAHVGLAVSYALSMSLMVVTLLTSLRRRLGGLDEVQVMPSLAKFAAAAAAMGLAIWYSAGYLGSIFSATSKLNELIVVGASIIAGTTVYVLALIGVKASEVAMLWEMVGSRMRKRSTQRVAGEQANG